MRLRSELDSILEAVLTVSPKRQYRGLRVPTTFATTGPEWKPTRMFTQPWPGLSMSMTVLRAASMALHAKSAIRLAWSADWSSTKFATAMYASPMVSTLKTFMLLDKASSCEYRRSNIAETLCGSKVPEMSVKPTMSEKKIVTMPWCSGSIFLPSRMASAMCRGKTSKSKSLVRRRRSSLQPWPFAAAASKAFSRRATSSKLGRRPGWPCQQSRIRTAISALVVAGMVGLFSSSSPSDATSASTSEDFWPA
mmetsp:Transcript_57257/g.164439  ORF Transcript_57257/g.164439 Transcript_57257/m.164439 type:complete len:251 (+) Transcript_57257:334-1086(+)